MFTVKKTNKYTKIKKMTTICKCVHSPKGEAVIEYVKKNIRLCPKSNINGPG